MGNFFSTNNNFPTNLFIGVSLLTFLLVGSFFITLTSIVSGSRNEAAVGGEKNNNSGPVEGKVDADEYTPGGDPLITKVPRMEDLIREPVFNNNDPRLGPEEASVTIVEFADHECAPCKEQQEILEEIRSNYPEEVAFIRKDYPVLDKDSPSFRAARAARCAQEQNKFWEYNDALYGDDSKFSRGLFLKIAKNLNLDAALFEECLTRETPDDMIISNIQEANALGITGIPFIYVNDRSMLGKTGYNDLERMVESEIEEQ